MPLPPSSRPKLESAFGVKLQHPRGHVAANDEAQSDSAYEEERSGNSHACCQYHSPQRPRKPSVGLNGVVFILVAHGTARKGGPSQGWTKQR
jgi:hypothetical protein